MPWRAETEGDVTLPDFGTVPWRNNRVLGNNAKAGPPRGGAENSIIDVRSMPGLV